MFLALYIPCSGIYFAELVSCDWLLRQGGKDCGKSHYSIMQDNLPRAASKEIAPWQQGPSHR